MVFIEFLCDRYKRYDINGKAKENDEWFSVTQFMVENKQPTTRRFETFGGGSIML